MRTTLFRLTTVVLFVATCFGNPRFSRDIPRDAADGKKIDVIIQFNAPPGQRDLSSVPGQVRKNLPAIDGAVFRMPVKALKGLEKNPRIRYVSPDRPVAATMDLAASTVGATAAWSWGYDGQGIGVAMLDSGIYYHNDMPFGSAVAYSEGFVPYDEDYIWDDYGHGNHVAGILAGRGIGSSRGVAPGSKVINMRVLDHQGRGYDSSIVEAIYRTIELKSQYNIRVMNLSVGRPVYESYELDPLGQAVQAAWEAGIVVVVAAGNDGRDNSFGNQGYGTINSPGNHPAVITVGAMNMVGTSARNDDKIASYSSKGPTVIDHIAKPDIVAPGNRVVSHECWYGYLWYYYPQLRVGTDEFRLSGTSMATPVVAGAAALLLEKEPWLTPDQVKARLMLTATSSFPVSSSGVDPTTGQEFWNDYDVFAVGAGYLDIAAALSSTETPSTAYSSASPRVEFDDATNEVTMVTDEAILWGRSVIWGRSASWATSVIWGRTAVIDDQSVAWGRSVIWGRSVVFGQGSPSANSVIWGRTSPYEDSGATSASVDSLTVMANGDQ